MPPSANSSPLETVKLGLAPSGASRWLHCRASPGFILRNEHRLPKDTSEYAEEGNRAHELAAALLLRRKELPPADDAEMLEHCEGYRAFVENKKKMMGEGTTMIVEQKAPLWYHPTRHGYIDCALLNPRMIHVIDLKYGMGVSVEAVGNPQLAIYGKAIIKHLKIKLPREAVVLLTIYQPRAQDNRFVRTWSLTLGELEEFCIREIEDVVMEIQLDPEGQKFSPDEEKACRFCPAKSICTAYVGDLLGDIPEEISPVVVADLPKSSTLTMDQVTRVLSVSKDIKGWLEDVESYAVAMILQGHSVPGYKLVEGRSIRKWGVEEKEVYKLLKRFIGRDKVYSQDLISPAQAEKLLKKPKRELTTRFKNRFQEILSKPMGNPTLVPQSDERPELSINKYCDLENLDADTQSLL